MFQKVSDKVDVGAQLSWSGANSMRFGIAAKFCAHPDATFRVSRFIDSTTHSSDVQNIILDYFTAGNVCSYRALNY